MGLHATVLGGGGWGTALSLLLYQNGHQVRIWEYDPVAANRMKETRESKFLPGVQIPQAIPITSDMEEALSEAELLLVAVPSHTVRSVVRMIDPELLRNTLIVSGTKGIENHTLKRVSEILREEWPSLSEGQIAVLSGPSHAEEVSRGIPTVVTVASTLSSTSKRIQAWLMNERFRVYTSRDVIGVELGGALKNVIAIAAGISDGVGFGDNTKAALMTRGIVEISRLGIAMGADPATFSGLSGIGDLIVTCTSRHSRNRYLGEQIGRGRRLQEVLEEMTMVAEGVRTTQSAVDLASIYHIDMPITREVYQVLFEHKPPLRAVQDLMTREPKEESP